MSGVIYLLKCPKSGAVRYVGKAKDAKARYRQHMYDARVGTKSHKCNWIRSLLVAGLRPTLEIDLVIGDSEDWKQREIERVAHYRAAGCDLTNSTNGGDEPGELTEAGRAILAESARSRFGTPEARVRQARIMRDLCSSPEWVEKRAAAGRITRDTPEYKAAASARSKARWADPAYRARMRQARAEVVARPEYRAKLSRATTAYMADRAARKAVAERTRASWAEGRRP